MFLDNKKITICALLQVDVPNCQQITLDMLEELSLNKTIKFGHGLCIALQIFRDALSFFNEN